MTEEENALYQQLENILNRYVILGRKPWGIENKSTVRVFENMYLEYDFEMFSIHDLFSKNSGVMEFVERLSQDTVSLNVNRSTEDCEDQFDGVDAKYMIMGLMKVDGKTRYFLDNIRIPTTQ